MEMRVVRYLCVGHLVLMRENLRSFSGLRISGNL